MRSYALTKGNKKAMHPTMRAIARIALLAVIVALGGGAIGTAPARADDNFCGPWSDEQDMIDTTSARCRSTWMIDPGHGNLISRQHLIDNAGIYTARGFTKQFLWYAPETTITLQQGSTQEWVSCPVNLHFGGVCPITATPEHHRLLRNFTNGSKQFHTFAYGNAVIMRACGNYWYPPPTHDSPPSPVPHTTIEKYDDRNRNGVRDSGEAALQGWRFRVIRTASRVGQGTGEVGVIATGGDGRARFDFNGHGPGIYELQEISQDGWAPTTAPSRVVDVAAGAGSAHIAHVAFGNAQTRADLVKADFTLVDPPQRLEAGQTANLTVRAVIRNDGPADVTAEDSIIVSVPADCTAQPAQATAIRALSRGQAATIDFPIRVRCANPSFHPMTFTDHLRVATAGVEDPALSDNTKQFEHVFEVFDKADIHLGQAAIRCADRSDVRVEFTCETSAVVGNAGPYGAVNTDVTVALRTPADCTADSDDAAASLTLAAGVSRTVTSHWRLTCTHRSYHPVTAALTATLDHLHVEDPVPGNATATADDTPEIFEAAALSLPRLDVRCTEREANTTASQCTATATVANGGPATDVKTRTVLTIDVQDGCQAAASGPATHYAELDDATETSHTTAWRITCGTSDRHSVQVTATVTADEPHAEDTARGDNSSTTTWGPADAKPRSLPSAVNIGKEGVLPFAVLSTADLNAVTDVDRGSLRFGRTGTENSVVSCATEGEDVNHDGRADLICRADTLVTGIDCSTTVLLLDGRLTDGTRFAAEDDVKVVGCRKP